MINLAWLPNRGLGQKRRKKLAQGRTPARIYYSVDNAVYIILTLARHDCGYARLLHPCAGKDRQLYEFDSHLSARKACRLITIKLQALLLCLGARMRSEGIR